jgi:hypothetical protein
LFEFGNLKCPDVGFEQPTNTASECVISPLETAATREADAFAASEAHEIGEKVNVTGRRKDTIETDPDRGQIAVQGKLNGFLSCARMSRSTQMEGYCPTSEYML